MAQTNRHTYTQQTDIATSRLNQPKGQCSERKQFYLAGLRHINKDYNTPIPKGPVWWRQMHSLAETKTLFGKTDMLYEGTNRYMFSGYGPQADVSDDIKAPFSLH